MARPRGRGRATPSLRRAGGTKKARGRSPSPDPLGPSRIYQEMLEEEQEGEEERARSSSRPGPLLRDADGEEEERRNPKRRRIGGRLVDMEAPPPPDSGRAVELFSSLSSPAPPLYKADRRTDDDDDDDDNDDYRAGGPDEVESGSGSENESEMDWEDVDLAARPVVDSGRGGEGGPARGEYDDDDGDERPAELSLTLGGPKKGPAHGGTPDKRRSAPLTAEERKLRLEIHKLHLLCLLSHAYLRNHWCNGSKVQKRMRKRLQDKTALYLTEDPAHSQFQRNRSLMDGLARASEEFRLMFQVSSRGLSRAYWAKDSDQLAASDVPDDIGLPIEKLDFVETASTFSGSRDIGAQLFCAMLRSVGLDVRLVVSLQPLPFNSSVRATTPLKPEPTMYYSLAETTTKMVGHENGKDLDETGNSSAEDSPSKRGVAGKLRAPPATIIQRSSAPRIRKTPKKKKRIRESPFPVYWVEVFNAAYQKWIPVDPLVTKTIGKSSKLEPPSSDPENGMSYVVAFEEDGAARDVTMRYAKAYNAKTRKIRIEATKSGDRWWKRVMKIYRRRPRLDREQVEDAQLSAKELAEPMPKNVQDFKGHPHYALERHLRRDEAIHPRRQIGSVPVGKGSGADKALEPIFRRNDVHGVKSEDAWYRVGRELKDGEEPLKYAVPRGLRRQVVDNDDGDAGQDGQGLPTEAMAGVPLFAAFQTQAYEPPPVVRGRVPRNAFGNLDVYVPSMVPPGGVHESHPHAVRAARLLGIDHVDAVTGFQFRGRGNATAVTDGVVIATEFHDALVETIGAIEHARQETALAQRTDRALRMWKRMMAGLRILKRIEGYEVEGEREEKEREMEKRRKKKKSREKRATVGNHRSDESADEDSNSDDSGPGGDDDDESSDDYREEHDHSDSEGDGSDDEEEEIAGGFEKGDRTPVRDEEQTSAAPLILTESIEIKSIFGKPYHPALEADANDGDRIKNEEHEENDSIFQDDVEEGGGFLPEIGEGEDPTSCGGGGFMLEEPPETNDEEIGEPHSAMETSGIEARRPGSPDQMQPDEAIRARHSLSPSARDTPPGNEATGSSDQAAATTVAAAAAVSRDFGGNEASHRVKEGTLPEAAEDNQAGEESDIGSLLSHDPEDEDAVPEWLL